MYFGTYIALFLGFIVPVLSTQYCSSITLNRISAISCGTNYHCCSENTKCCRDAGFLTNGAIVGIAVAGAIVVALIICITVCFVKSRQPGKTSIFKGNTHVESIESPTAPTDHAGYDQAIVGENTVTNPPPYSETSDNPPKYII